MLQGAAASAQEADEGSGAEPTEANLRPVAAAPQPVPTARVLRVVPSLSGTAQGGPHAFADSDINTGSPRATGAQNVPWQRAGVQPGGSRDTTPPKRLPFPQGTDMREPSDVNARSSKSELFPLPSLTSLGGLETPPSVSRPPAGADPLPPWARNRALQPSPPKPPVLLYTAGFGKSSSSSGTASEGDSAHPAGSHASSLTVGLASPMEVGGTSRLETSQRVSTPPRTRPLSQAQGSKRGAEARRSVLALEALASSGIPLSPSPQKAEGAPRGAEGTAASAQSGVAPAAQERATRVAGVRHPKVKALGGAQAHNPGQSNEGPLQFPTLPEFGERQGEGQARGAVHAAAGRRVEASRGEGQAALDRIGPGGLSQDAAVPMEGGKAGASSECAELEGHPGVDPRISLSETLTIPRAAQDGTSNPSRNPRDRPEDSSLPRSKRHSRGLDVSEGGVAAASVFDPVVARTSNTTSPPTPVLFRCKSAPGAGSRGDREASSGDRIASQASGALPARLFEETSSNIGSSALARSVSAMGPVPPHPLPMRTSVSSSQLFRGGPGPSGDQATVSGSEPSFNVLAGLPSDSEATITALTGENLSRGLPSIHTGCL